MTTTNEPMTARSFLFTDVQDAGMSDGLGPLLHEQATVGSALRILRHLSGSVAATVDHEVGAVVERMLELDLGDVLVSGWRKHADLVEAARRTLALAGSEEVVVLGSHRVTSTYRPRVDLYVDELRVSSLEFELRIAFRLTGVAAVVRAGDLVSLRGGDCTVDVTLELEGAVLAHRRRGLDLGVALPLAHPVALVDKVTVPVQPAS